MLAVYVSASVLGSVRMDASTNLGRYMGHPRAPSQVAWGVPTPPVHSPPYSGV